MTSLTHRLAGCSSAVANVGLGLVLAGLLAVNTAFTAARHGNWLFDLLIGGVVCVLALLRGRNLLWVGGVTLITVGIADVAARVGPVPQQPGIVTVAGLLVVGTASVRALPARFAAAVSIAGTMAMLLDRASVQPPHVSALGLASVLLWGGALGVGMWLRILDVQRRMEMEMIRRDERLELARELHDVVAHHVAGIVVQTQAARLIGTRRPDDLDDVLATIESAGTDALAAMRRVVGLLREGDDATPRKLGPEQLDDLVDRLERYGIAVELQLPSDDMIRWPVEVADTMYRIVREALTNVLLHATGAHRVTVGVIKKDSTVTIEITDDAPPSATRVTERSGYGLIGMKERVEALGGSLVANPRAEGGWVVHATLPLGAGGST